MKADFINPFLNASYSVLDMLLGSVPTKSNITAQPRNITAYHVNVVCGVTGRLQGQIIFGMSETTSNRIASMMAGTPQKMFDSFVASAVAELGNMISGNALMHLSELGYVCDITPPTVIRGANVEISTLQIPAISITLDTGHGELALIIGLSEAATEVAKAS